MGRYKKDYSLSVHEKRKNSFIGFSSSEDDAQLVADVINMLANEDNMTTSRAQSILSDAMNLVPKLSTI